MRRSRPVTVSARIFPGKRATCTSSPSDAARSELRRSATVRSERISSLGLPESFFAVTNASFDAHTGGLAAATFDGLRPAHRRDARALRKTHNTQLPAIPGLTDQSGGFLSRQAMPLVFPGGRERSGVMVASCLPQQKAALGACTEKYSITLRKINASVSNVLNDLHERPRIPHRRLEPPGALCQPFQRSPSPCASFCNECSRRISYKISCCADQADPGALLRNLQQRRRYPAISPREQGIAEVPDQYADARARVPDSRSRRRYRPAITSWVARAKLQSFAGLTFCCVTASLMSAGRRSPGIRRRRDSP